MQTATEVGTAVQFDDAVQLNDVLHLDIHAADPVPRDDTPALGDAAQLGNAVRRGTILRFEAAVQCGTTSRPHPGIRIDVARPGRTIVLAGRLDVATVADVRLALHGAVDTGTGDLLVDLAGVEVIDASGLGVLVGAHRRAGRAGRRVLLRNVPDRIERLLAVTRLNRVLHLEAAVPLARTPQALAVT